MRRIVVAVATALFIVSAAHAQSYPDSKITIVVVWPAGGRTDVANRVVTQQMAGILGVNIDVINLPGGSGLVGVKHVLERPADGYTLLGMSEGALAALQLSTLGGVKDWYPFIIGGSPIGVSVPANAPYKTFNDLISAASKQPGTVVATAGRPGSTAHLNLLALEEGTGVGFKSALMPRYRESVMAAMRGEVTMVVTPLHVQKEVLQARKLRPLAVLTPGPFKMQGIEPIPSAFDKYPKLKDYLPISPTIAMLVPAEAANTVKKVLTNAFTKALQSDAVRKWADANSFVISGKTGEEARKEFMGLVLANVGAAGCGTDSCKNCPRRCRLCKECQK